MKSMRVVALISGGKDSIFNAMCVTAEGHQVIALANLHPKDKDELDSFMYQTVGHMGIEKIAECLELPLYRRETTGTSLQKGKCYEPVEEDEVEDLFKLLQEVKDNEQIEAVASGAIFSNYQRVRVENVCERLQLKSLTYLWQRDQTELLQEMIDNKIEAIIIKVASLGLTPGHLGKTISEVKPHLLTMKEKYGLNVCGEGGEYETFTLDCPLFKRKKIIVEDVQRVISSSDPVCSTAYLNLVKLNVVPKSIQGDLSGVKLSLDFVKNLESFTELPPELPQDELDDSNQDDVEVELPSVETLINQISVTFNPNGWILLSGVQSEETDIAESIKNCLNKVNQLLSQFECSLKNIVRITLYVNNMQQFGELNAAYLSVINFQNPPTRACVECKLPDQCNLILEVIAHQFHHTKPESEHNVNRLHVQSMSHWAPANIGPYSQAIKVEYTTFVSGQIGLVPGSMEIITGGLRQECRLSLRHIVRVLDTMDVKKGLRDVVQGICFVADRTHISTAKKLWEAQSNNSIIEYIAVHKLPRNASIEWQVWAHDFNDKFQYEETGRTMDNFSVSLTKRWNVEVNCSALIAHISILKSPGTVPSTARINQPSKDILRDVFSYVAMKMKYEDDDDNENIRKHVSINLQIFYNQAIFTGLTDLFEILSQTSKADEDLEIVYTVVPVKGFESLSTLFSVIGNRF